MNIKLKFLAYPLLLICQIGFSQSFNVEQFKNTKLVAVTGGFNASSILYSGLSNRDPFALYLNGNINFNIAGLYSLPFSFAYSTQKFGYSTPVLINRLSVHPSYKWITSHIGDVSMTFSPYTLSGHQFSGVGVDLSPKGNFKISAMYGRLLKKVEYDSLNASTVPVYKRMGYGFKTSYDFEKVNLNFIFFKAKDELNSLQTKLPSQLGINPKDNAVLSLGTQFKLFKKFQFQTEIATSSVTEDTRDEQKTTAFGLGKLFITQNATTTTYNAYKAQFTYPIAKGSLGLGYERIDPNYKTLGAYYFNNDLENMTLNATQTVFKDKVNLSFNVGLQSDNLDNAKTSQSKRLLSAVNAEIKPNEKWNLGINYSNLQSFTNSRNQFDYINEIYELENLDTLNYRQINQSFNLNLNHLLRNDNRFKKNINANFSVQNSDNQQDGETIANGSTQFYNAALAFSLGFVKKALTITSALNTSFDEADTKNLILGPTLVANKTFFDKKLNSSCSLSYNNSYTDGILGIRIFNLRLNAGYLYKQKHNFNFSTIVQQSQTTQTKNKDITATFSYAYSFDKIKIHANKPKPNQTKDSLMPQEQIFKIKFKNFDLEGSRQTISDSLKKYQNQLYPLTVANKASLQLELDKTATASTEKDFKEKVLNYLELLDPIQTQINLLNQTVDKSIQSLIIELKSKDVSIEEAYQKALENVTEHPLHNKVPETESKVEINRYQKLLERSNIQKQKVLTQRWMLQEFEKIMSSKEPNHKDNPNLQAFYEQEAEKLLEIIKNPKNSSQLNQEVELALISVFHHLAVTNTVNAEVELKYILKN
jgi:hypothetical protein